MYQLSRPLINRRTRQISALDLCEMLSTSDHMERFRPCHLDKMKNLFAQIIFLPTGPARRPLLCFFR